MGEVYYAKSRLSNGKQPTVREHLNAVMKMAEAFGVEVNMSKSAYVAGAWHDVGKYSPAFQRVLRGEEHNIDHAVSGAAILHRVLEKQQKKHAGLVDTYTHIIEAICAHHDGLVSYSVLQNRFTEMWSGTEREYGESHKTPSLVGEDALTSARQTFHGEFPDVCLKKIGKECFVCNGDDTGKQVRSMLRTRMLLSCLVDADYTVSALDENADYLSQSEHGDMDVQACLDKLYEHMRTLRQSSSAAQGVNALRNELFARCGAAGEEGAPGLYTLTAPTGTGKTLSMLHFALRHCLHYGKHRIIVVLPFLTLTEQSAKEYRHIVRDVFEDHSQADLRDEEREFSSRWRIPFVITTSVRFFESLFRSKPTDCRKLHNIANSVILFDEVQSLPPKLLSATLNAAKALCEEYGCTMLFSSATQPAFDCIKGMAWQPTEVLPDHEHMYGALRRTCVTWRVEHDQRMSFEQVAEEMSREHSACAIVNVRRHVRRLFAALKQRRNGQHVFMLSTDLCPAHRKAQIERIRALQQRGEPCLAVATQCIEAGVDLDFDRMWRALAPLDSITQAAGRCNRNGRLAQGRVTVFVPDEDDQDKYEKLYPDDWYEKAANIVRDMVMEGGVDIHSATDIRRYYEWLLADAKDNKALQEAIKARNYEETAKEYKLICKKGNMVIVPYKGEKALYDEIYAEYMQNGMNAGLLKRAAPITVTTYENEKTIEAVAERMLYPPRNGVRQQSDTFILRRQCEGLYTDDNGLMLKEMCDNSEGYVL